MLKALLLSFSLVLAVMAIAQVDLVPNGSFEDTTHCLTQGQSFFLKAAHWLNPNTATPDVWDEDLDRLCGLAMAPSMGAPYRPAYDGIRVAGAYHWDGPGNGPTRDYLMVKLTSPMNAETAYEVSLWYARRKGHASGIDHIGVWFGQDSIHEAHYGWLAPTPQVKLRDPQNTFLTEADEWTLLKDTLIAEGGEQWMVIGNFDPADEVNGIQAEDSWNTTCYYYIDEVSVHEITSVGFYETPIIARWYGNVLILEGFGSDEQIQIRIWDSLGRLIRLLTLSQQDSKVDVRLPDLPSGIYIVDIASRESKWSRKVVVME